MEACRNSEPIHSSFDLKQEKILAKDPLAMRLMILLSTGMSFQMAQSRLSDVAKNRIKKATFVLAKLDLIDIYENDIVRIKKRGPFKFLENGPLFKTYKKIYIKKMAEQIILANPTDSLNRTFELIGTQELIDKMVLEINSVIKKHTSLSSLETKTKQEEDLIPISCVFMINRFGGWDEVLRELHQ